jgi:pimeloyl-ACP methyl ester carboxylesterase
VNSLTHRPFWTKAEDGTRLFTLDCGVTSGSKIPLLCLPGLTRNHRDFEPVIDAFAAERRVIAADFRGRGKSAHAKDPMSYNPVQELADTIKVLDELRVGKFAVLGTSRGGIVGMLAANTHPDRVAGLLLNDIGPVIDVAGLKRIAGYVGKSVVFPSWETAAQAISWSSFGFADVSSEQWITIARRLYGEVDGRPVTEHDPDLAVTFPKPEQIDKDGIKDSWNLMPALAAMPVTVLRGGGSDILSAETLSEITRRFPHIVPATIEGRGHVPFLDEPESLTAIRDWLERVDKARRS